MPALLLDTHAIFWAMYDPESLSVHAVAALNDSANEVYVTPVSAQEIAMKLSVGKWPEAEDLLRNFEQRVREAGYGLIQPVALDYLNAARLPNIPGHSDPFDRLIIAQAMARGMVLISSDGYIGSYGVPSIHAGSAQRAKAKMTRTARIIPVETLDPIELVDTLAVQVFWETPEPITVGAVPDGSSQTIASTAFTDEQTIAHSGPSPR